MTHEGHVGLLQAGVPEPGGLWTDLGSGTGAFTLARADLLGSDARIISIDRDSGALREQEARTRERFPAAAVEYRTADFTRPLDLPPLDGALLANALHFHRDQRPNARRIRGFLRPGGRLLLVEYDTDRGNPWVPYPRSYPSWEGLAREAGSAEVRLLATRPSRFLGRIYSALSQTSA